MLMVLGVLTSCFYLPMITRAAFQPRSPHSFAEADKFRRAREQEFFDTKHGAVPVPGCRYESFIARRPPPGKVALTFDDGPSRDLTPWILSILAKRRVPGTFFLKAERASRNPTLVTRIARDGHVIGNHSWEHPNFHVLAQDAQALSVNRADQFLAPVLNPLKLFRYPYGNSTCATNALVRTMGYRIVGWHQDSCDWAFDRTGTVDAKDAQLCAVAPDNLSNFVGHVVQSVNARRGGILLMHEIHRNTIRQLDKVIEALARSGYRFVSMADPDMRVQAH